MSVPSVQPTDSMHDAFDTRGVIAQLAPGASDGDMPSAVSVPVRVLEDVTAALDELAGLATDASPDTSTR